KKDPVSACTTFTPNRSWHLLAILGMVTSFFLLSFYSVVGGWILLYLFQTSIGTLSNHPDAEYGSLFSEFISNPAYAILAQFSIMAMTIIVVAKGIQKGIERASKIMMPALFIAFIILIIRSLTLDNMSEGISFFLYPDFSNFSSKAILFALGQSFFSISVGVS